MDLFITIRMRLRAIIILTFLSLPLYGQQEPYFAFTQFNLSLINPAYAGVQGKDVFTLATRSQWSSVEGAPESYAFTYNTERNNNVGVGLSFISDKTFIEQQTFAYVDFSYKLQFSEKSRLFLGLKGGGNFYSADLSSLENFNNLNDPTKVPMSRLKPNLGIGAYLTLGDNWIAVSAPRLIEVSRTDQEDVFAKDRVHFYAAAGTSFTLNTTFSIKPSVAVRQVKGLALVTEVMALFSYNNQFSGGIQIRDNSSMGVLAMLPITDSIGIGYAYESFRDNDLSKLNLTSHEFFIRVRLGKVKDDSQVPEEAAKETLPSDAEKN